MQLNLSSSFRRSLKRGSRIIVLITDNQASKLAFKLAKGILHPQDELQLVTVVMGEESLEYGSRLLAPLLPSEQQQQQNGPTISPVVSSTAQALLHTGCSQETGLPALLLSCNTVAAWVFLYKGSSAAPSMQAAPF